MAPFEAIKPDNSTAHGDKPKQLDRELKDMMSALTNRLTLLQRAHKSGPSHRGEEGDEGEDNDDSFRIITLSGSNTGATMRGGELDTKTSIPHSHQGSIPPGSEHDALTTYINSNFQAINNSVMLGGSYSTNDPGVHVDISDDFLDDPRYQKIHKLDKHAKKKGKKKEKDSSTSEHSEHSDKASK